MTTTYFGSLSSGLTLTTNTTAGQVAAALAGTPTERVGYGFDSLGRQDLVVDQTFSASGSVLATDTETKTFDPVTGGVTSITTPSGTINYAYDPATGNHVETWTDSNQTLYGYNALGQLSTVTVTELNGTNLATPQVTTYTDDYNGNLKTVAQADGVTTTYTFDKLNRLTTEVATVSTGAVVASYVYTLASDGSRLTVLEHQEETNGTFSDVQVSYEYDGDGRLTREFDDASSGTSASGQPIFSTTGVPDSAGDFSDTYTYDLAGNRISQAHETISQSGSASPAASTTTTDLSYDARNELTSQTVTATGSAPVITTDAYDANGNQTSSGANTYTWDVRNRMTSATVSGVTTTYGYDSDGTRLSETTGGSTTTFLNDPLNPTGYVKAVEERVNGALARSYVLGLRVEAVSDGQGTAYQLTDGHGSTRALFAAGAATSLPLARFNYDAFGNAINFNAATARTEWLYGGGGEYDVGSGMYVAGVRFYQSAYGNWTSSDPRGAVLGDLGNANLYSFVGGNPIDLVDPTGLFVDAGLVGTLATVSLMTIMFTMLAFNAAIVGQASWSLRTALDPSLEDVAVKEHTTVQETEPVQEDGYRYFVHGATTESFFGLLPNPTRPELDFGLGLYAYPATFRGEQKAAELAHNKAGFMAQDGGKPGVPFLEIFRVKESTYENFSKVDFNTPEYAPQYSAVVNSYRDGIDPFSNMDIDVMIGQTAKKVGSQWVARNDANWPDQYAFKSGHALDNLRPVAIVPLNN